MAAREARTRPSLTRVFVRAASRLTRAQVALVLRQALPPTSPTLARCPQHSFHDSHIESNHIFVARRRYACSPGHIIGRHGTSTLKMSKA